MTNYEVETFTGAEADVLRRYVTNLDKPVFALVNLPEVVKGALFARYSRTHKTLRRLLIDEFIDDLDVSGDITIDATAGLARAEQLYERVFVEYGDDSVAQLGSVHLACEQVSNLLTKVLERPRLMSYLEQSTRYLPYNQRRMGRYLYIRPPEVMDSPAGLRYIGTLDRIFENYGELNAAMGDYYRHKMRPTGQVADIAHARAVKAKAYDAARGLLPTAAVSNVGIFGSGQAFEALLLRLRVHPLPEARRYGAMMLTELRKVIPSFLRRVDQAERGIAWSNYLKGTREGVAEFAHELLADAEQAATEQIAAEQADAAPAHEVELVDWDPHGETKMLAAMLYPYSHLSEHALVAQVERLTNDERVGLVRRYVGERTNRRHRPGRALERIDYRFDVLADYGGFRDLQRHRLLTIDWQQLSTRHSYVVPDDVADAKQADIYDAAMEKSAVLHADLAEHLGETQAAYAVCLGYRIRYSMQMNAREAMHVIELRTQPSGHTEYRRICAEMADLIKHKAGHAAVAAMFSYADMTDAAHGRLAAEQDTQRRAQGGAGGGDA